MASIHTEVTIERHPDEVWAAIRDVGAVHERLLPDRLASASVDGDVRTLVFPDGTVVRELIVDVDDATRRLAYAVVAGARAAITHHHASFQVFPDGAEGSRLVWITDLLPDALAPAARARVEQGARDIKRTLEG